MELRQYEGQTIIELTFGSEVSREYYDTMCIRRIRGGQLSVGWLDGEWDEEFRMNYKAFENALDQFLDEDAGSGFKIPVVQHNEGRILEMTHLEDDVVVIIGPCGMKFRMRYGELDDIYAALPKLT